MRMARSFNDFVHHRFWWIRANKNFVWIRRVMLDLVSATALGGLSALGVAPWSAWPVTILGLIGLIYWLASTTSRRSAFLRGWFFGLGLGCFSLGV